MVTPPHSSPFALDWTEARRVALHEAAHAVIAHRLGFGIERVSAHATGGVCETTGGEWVGGDRDERDLLYRLAGYNAEALAGYGDAGERGQASWSHSGGDARRSGELVRSLWPESPESVLAWGVETVCELLRASWPAVERLAEVLLYRVRLSGGDAVRIIEEAMGS